MSPPAGQRRSQGAAHRQSLAGAPKRPAELTPSQSSETSSKRPRIKDDRNTELGHRHAVHRDDRKSDLTADKYQADLLHERSSSRKTQTVDVLYTREPHHGELRRPSDTSSRARSGAHQSSVSASAATDTSHSHPQRCETIQKRARPSVANGLESQPHPNFASGGYSGPSRGRQPVRHCAVPRSPFVEDDDEEAEDWRHPKLSSVERTGNYTLDWSPSRKNTDEFGFGFSAVEDGFSDKYLPAPSGSFAQSRKAAHRNPRSASARNSIPLPRSRASSHVAATRKSASDEARRTKQPSVQGGNPSNSEAHKCSHDGQAIKLASARRAEPEHPQANNVTWAPGKVAVQPAGSPRKTKKNLYETGSGRVESNGDQKSSQNMSNRPAAGGKLNAHMTVRKPSDGVKAFPGKVTGASPSPSVKQSLVREKARITSRTGDAVPSDPSVKSTTNYTGASHANTASIRDPGKRSHPVASNEPENSSRTGTAAAAVPAKAPEHRSSRSNIHQEQETVQPPIGEPVKPRALHRLASVEDASVGSGKEGKQNEAAQKDLHKKGDGDQRKSHEPVAAENTAKQVQTSGINSLSDLKIHKRDTSHTDLSEAARKRQIAQRNAEKRKARLATGATTKEDASSGHKLPKLTRPSPSNEQGKIKALAGQAGLSGASSNVPATLAEDSGSSLVAPPRASHPPLSQSPCVQASEERGAAGSTSKAEHDSEPYRQEMLKRMEKLSKDDRISPPCDRCRRLRIDCEKHFKACKGCHKKRSRCSWREVRESELQEGRSLSDATVHASAPQRTMNSKSLKVMTESSGSVPPALPVEGESSAELFISSKQQSAYTPTTLKQKVEEGRKKALEIVKSFPKGAQKQPAVKAAVDPSQPVSNDPRNDRSATSISKAVLPPSTTPQEPKVQETLPAVLTDEDNLLLSLREENLEWSEIQETWNHRTNSKLSIPFLKLRYQQAKRSVGERPSVTTQNTPAQSVASPKVSIQAQTDEISSPIKAVNTGAGDIAAKIPANQAPQLYADSFAHNCEHPPLRTTAITSAKIPNKSTAESPASPPPFLSGPSLPAPALPPLPALDESRPKYGGKTLNPEAMMAYLRSLEAELLSNGSDTDGPEKEEEEEEGEEEEEIGENKGLAAYIAPTPPAHMCTPFAVVDTVDVHNDNNDPNDTTVHYAYFIRRKEWPSFSIPDIYEWTYVRSDVPYTTLEAANVAAGREALLIRNGVGLDQDTQSFHYERLDGGLASYEGMSEGGECWRIEVERKLRALGAGIRARGKGWLPKRVWDVKVGWRESVVSEDDLFGEEETVREWVEDAGPELYAVLDLANGEAAAKLLQLTTKENQRIEDVLRRAAVQEQLATTVADLKERGGAFDVEREVREGLSVRVWVQERVMVGPRNI